MIDQNSMGPGQPPQRERLVLPAPPDYAGTGAAPTSAYTSRPRVEPEMLVRRSSPPPPRNLSARPGYFWRKDPAYRVLMIAILVAVVAGIVFAALVGNMLLSSGNQGTQTISVVPQTPPPGARPTGTVDLRPTFAPPGGGKGSGSSSQPPAVPTPSLSITPTATPGNNPGGGGAITVQVSGIPDPVANNSNVQVTVMTGEPNVNVQLQVRYSAAPFFFVTVGATDGNGMAVLNWNVQVFANLRPGKHVTAKGVVFAQDQNGQRGSSNTFTVRIVGNGGGM